MHRIKTNLRAIAIFIAGASFGVALALALSSANAKARRYSPYRKLNIFAKVLTYVENNYVDHVDDSKLVYGAIKGMMDSLDPHSLFMPPNQYRQLKADTEGEFGGVGIEVEMRDGEIKVIAPIEDTPAFRAGIKPGDVIVSIDGKKARGMRMNEAVRLMRGRRGTRVKLGVRRKGQKKPLMFELVRDVIKVVSVTSKLLQPGIGYVRIKSFQERTHHYLKQALATMQKQGKLGGLVLDLRNNPGGLLDQAVRVADLFLKKGLIVRTVGKGGRTMDREMATSSGTQLGFPIICLVNGGSASASEIVAGALQDHKRAVVLGTRTFGKGSVQTIIELSDGSGLKLTVARYYTPKGRSIQERGIQPDIIVQPTAPPVRKDKKQREADLKGHLRNKQAPKSDKKRPTRLKDFQLQTALDHLKAAAIFKSHGG
jgi:carboxyl-terminal processing protease